MPLIKRKDSPQYWYSFYIEGVRYRGSTGTSDRNLAQAIESKTYEREFLKVKFGKKEDILLRHAFGKYWVEHASNQKWKGTVSGFIKNMEACWGLDIYLSDITNQMLGKLVLHLKKKGLSGASINRHIACFRKIHTLARTIWEVNVSELNFGLHRQQEADCRVRYLTKPEIDLLLKSASPHLRPIILFALYTGARRSNILNLQWRDVDMASKRIVFKVKSSRPGGKHHQVDMVSDCYKLLAELKIKANSPYVFGWNGKKVDDVKTAFKAACRRAQISDFRFHDLRHTCASWLVQGGTPIEIVKEILGHEDISTTLKYAHHRKQQKIAALEKTFKSRISHAGMDTKLKLASSNG
jgi:integrase